MLKSRGKLVISNASTIPSQKGGDEITFTMCGKSEGNVEKVQSSTDYFRQFVTL